jgi:hypothetical protein
MVNAAEVFGKAQGQDIFLTQALKEWAIAISALRTGELVLLLRKGGIRDPIHPFAAIPRRAALFPTYEHQVPHYLKQPRLPTPPEPNAPIAIDTWATITHGFELSTEAEVAALMPFHIWTAAFVAERLKWRSPQPLQALLLRVYQLPEAAYLGRSPSHAGCRSWIDLDPGITIQNSIPALSDQDYHRRLEAIERAIQSEKKDFRLETFERQ